MKTNEFSIGILIVEFSSFFRGGGGSRLIMKQLTVLNKIQLWLSTDIIF